MKSKRKCPQCGWTAREWLPLVVTDGVPDGLMLLGSLPAATVPVIDWGAATVRAHLHGAANLWRIDQCYCCGATVTA